MYKDENDYELLYMIREEDETPKDMFYEKYRPMVEMKAKKYFSQIQNKGYELNDLIQEGMIGLSNAIRDFNQDEETKFATFASVCVERNIINFIREINRQKHQALNSYVSIHQESNSGRTLLDILDDKSSTNPENSFILLEEQEELKEKVKENLTDFEKEVFDLRFEGFTYQEISILLNKSIKSIDGTISRIKQKILNDKKNID